jgi:hypothetical protein
MKDSLKEKFNFGVKEDRLLLRLDNGRSPHAYVNQRLQIQLEVLMMNNMLFETC